MRVGNDGFELRVGRRLEFVEVLDAGLVGIVKRTDDLTRMCPRDCCVDEPYTRLRRSGDITAAMAFVLMSSDHSP